MASKLVLALGFALLFISQVSSSDHPMKNEETSDVSQALHLHVFNRGGDRKLMHNLVVDLSKYFKGEEVMISSAVAPAHAQAPSPGPSHHPAIDCGGLCSHRCSQHSRPNVCVRACGTCCERCKCVPPGTFGNREVCGNCYTNMTTHGNKPKCP